MSDCKACQLYHSPVQSLSSLKSLRLQYSNPSKKATDVEAELKSKKPVLKPTQSAIKDTARDVYDKVDQPFKELFSIELKDALTKPPELQLQTKPSHAESKRACRARATKCKNSIQHQWSAVDVDTFLGTRQSFSQRDHLRKALSFESPELAKARTEKRKLDEDAGTRKPKKHSPDHTECTFDRAGLLEEVNNMNDGDKVCLFDYDLIYII